MARTLKTYTTSAGFFDLAVAAPSMKAALEAWGSKNNLFHHGFAKVSEDPKIVAATMAHPGVVLRRPVGSNGAFSEHAKLPTDLPVGNAKRAPATRSAKTREPLPPEAVDDKASREAARAFEKEQKRRESERRREEAAQQKERARRERAIAAAEAALEEARQDHEAKLEDIEKDRAALDRRSQAEDARWRKKKEELEAGLRRARSGGHLRLV
jgi:colicin import membrane protein